MFEHVVLRRAERGLPVTAGQVAEALLYYQKVHLVIDRGTLINLARQIGVGNVKSLLQRPELTAVYCHEQLMTQTRTFGVTEYYDLGAMSLTGHEKVKFTSSSEGLQHDLEREGIARRDAKVFATWFCNTIPARRLTGDYFMKGGIPAAARRDLSDELFVRSAAREILSFWGYGYKVDDELKFDLLQTDQGYCAFSNVNFAALNACRAKVSPPEDPITIAHLLSVILDARADLAMAAHYGGDFVTSGVTSSIIRLRFAELLRRTDLNFDARKQFVDVILPDSPSLADAIDANERSMEQFFNLLDKAGRFKNWLGAVNPDEGLVREYMLDIKSEPWIQGLSGKTLRYALSAGLGFVGTVTGLVAGAVDTFVVDKLLPGWRPNHFVDKKLTPFVRGY